MLEAAAGAETQGTVMTSTFFEAGKVYRHYLAGRPSPEGLFVVAYVGRAPGGFEDPSEAAGVAFGWRRGPGPGAPAGSPETGLGSYVSADFAGWTEVPDTDLLAQTGGAGAVRVRRGDGPGPRVPDAGGPRSG